VVIPNHWDLETGQTSELESPKTAISAVAVTSDSRRGLSGSHDGMLRLWDLANGQAIREIKAHAVSNARPLIRRQASTTRSKAGPVSGALLL
jgi:WD40 repeat protein